MKTNIVKSSDDKVSYSHPLLRSKDNICEFDMHTKA